MKKQILRDSNIPTLKYGLEFIQFLILIHVNSFIILFGYYQSRGKFKLKKLIRLFIEVLFYSLIMLIVAIKFNWIENINITVFFDNLLPSAVSNYWFINAYMIVYIFSDFLNKFLERLDRKEYKDFLILGFFVLSVIPYLTGKKFLTNTGYDYTNFIYLYLIGAYLSRYPLKDTYHFKKFSINVYRLLLFIAFISLALVNYLLVDFAVQINNIGTLANYISNRILVTKCYYSTPFVMLQAICYFEFFRTINIKSKIINFISSCTFGIYLFHDNNYMSSHIYKILKIDNGLICSYSILYKILIGVVIIFVVGLMIEIIRKIIFKILEQIYENYAIKRKE